MSSIAGWPHERDKLPWNGQRHQASFLAGLWLDNARSDIRMSSSRAVCGCGADGNGFPVRMRPANPTDSCLFRSNWRQREPSIPPVMNADFVSRPC